VLSHRELGLHGGLFAALFEDGPRGIGEDFVHHLGHEGLAVNTPQVLHGYLARPEAFQPHLLAGILKPLHQAGFHVLGRNNDLDLALQTGIESLANLHSSNLCVHSRRASQPSFGPAEVPAGVRPGLQVNTSTARPATLPVKRVVRVEGLEPPRLAPQEPKSCVSTSSTTPARRTPPPKARVLYHLPLVYQRKIGTRSRFRPAYRFFAVLHLRRNPIRQVPTRKFGHPMKPLVHSCG